MFYFKTSVKYFLSIIKFKKIVYTTQNSFYIQFNDLYLHGQDFKKWINIFFIKLVYFQKNFKTQIFFQYIQRLKLHEKNHLITHKTNYKHNKDFYILQIKCDKFHNTQLRSITSRNLLLSLMKRFEKIFKKILNIYNLNKISNDVENKIKRYSELLKHPYTDQIYHHLFDYVVMFYETNRYYMKQMYSNYKLYNRQYMIGFCFFFIDYIISQQCKNRMTYPILQCIFNTKFITGQYLKKYNVFTSGAYKYLFDSEYIIAVNEYGKYLQKKFTKFNIKKQINLSEELYIF